MPFVIPGLFLCVIKTFDFDSFPSRRAHSGKIPSVEGPKVSENLILCNI